MIGIPSLEALDSQTLGPILGEGIPEDHSFSPSSQMRRVTRLSQTTELNDVVIHALGLAQRI